jgi:hypothetical protein
MVFIGLQKPARECPEVLEGTGIGPSAYQGDLEAIIGMDSEADNICGH